MNSKVLVLTIVALGVVGWMALPTTGLVGSAGPSAVGVALEQGRAAQASHPFDAVAAASGTAVVAAPHAPTWTTSASSASSPISAIPYPTNEAPWIQNLAHRGPALKPLVSLPNLNLLEHPPTSVVGSVSPGYVAQPPR